MIVVGLGGVMSVMMVVVIVIGIGIFLGIVGFVFVLYVESFEDDLNEIFLKCCYWGKSECIEICFVVVEEFLDKRNFEEMLMWSECGLVVEVKGF